MLPIHNINWEGIRAQILQSVQGFKSHLKQESCTFNSLEMNIWGGSLALLLPQSLTSAPHNKTPELATAEYFKQTAIKSLDKMDKDFGSQSAKLFRALNNNS